MKFLHTSDLHIGIALNNISLIDFQKQAIDCLIKTAKDNSVDGVFVCGDVFDRSVVGVEYVQLYSDMVEAFAKNRIKLFMIAGNHDGGIRLSALNSLLKTSGIFIEGSIKRPLAKYRLSDANQNVDIYMLPHFNSEEGRYIYQADGQIYQKTFEKILSETAQSMDKSAYNILLGHCYVNGSQLSGTDKAAVLGQAFAVNGQIFADYDYVALGHLHKAQQVDKNVYYSGTPLKYSFSEQEHTKSFSLIDTSTNEHTLLQIPDFCKMRTISGTYESVCSQVKQLQGLNELVRVVIADSLVNPAILKQLRKCCDYLVSVSSEMTVSTTVNKLTADNATAMTATELMQEYIKDVTQKSPTQLQYKYFENAVNAVENGGA